MTTETSEKTQMGKPRDLAERCLNDCFTDYFANRDLTKTLTHLDAHVVTGFGTGIGEVCLSRDGLVELFHRDLTEAPNPVHMTNTAFHYDLIDEETCLAWGTLDLATTIEGMPLCLTDLRFSLLFRRRESDYKITHLHMSFPYIEQGEDESYPLKELRRRNEELEAMVAERTRDLEILLDDKETLLHEVHHRIKNNLSTLRSLLALQARALPNSDARVALEEASNRVTSMAIIYDRLCNSDMLDGMTLEPYLVDLLHEVASAYAVTTEVQLDARIDDIDLPVQYLFPIGIIINELVTNAYKHAYADRANGHILVTVSLKAPNTMEIIVQDDGAGLPEDVLASPNAYGFGLNLVHILTRQIGGTLQAANAGGARFSIECPVPTEG